ncbi:hypothetical protein RchiOBHm_Chr6g0308591 [Rosa chinensis]|uniref:Uncharacterized protein n=1 Tax=Rosa chinensis TaxID=74649 RepID=A0A2P6Q0T5_ROSCH|nr:hypothetical protein RchiOBHm_Chr6g0308591 [Rosa chinensis]
MCSKICFVPTSHGFFYIWNSTGTADFPSNLMINLGLGILEKAGWKYLVGIYHKSHTIIRVNNVVQIRRLPSINRKT